MNYKGEIYGKVNGKYIQLTQTVANLESINKELLEALKDVASSRHIMMVQSPTKVELTEILATFERVNAAISKYESL